MLFDCYIEIVKPYPYDMSSPATGAIEVVRLVFLRINRGICLLQMPLFILFASSTLSVYSFTFLFNITNSITSAAVAKIWAIPAKPEIIPFMPEESSVPSTSKTPLTTSIAA